MPWLKRGNNAYFYQFKTVRGKEVSQYLGHGPAAKAASHAIESRKAQRARLAALRLRDQTLDRQFDLLCNTIHAEISASLVPKGYRRYRTQWVIVGRGRKIPLATDTIAASDSFDSTRNRISDLAEEIHTAVLARLDPAFAKRLQLEIAELRQDLNAESPSSLKKLMIDQVLTAHAINMVSMLEEGLVPLEDAFVGERQYYMRRLNRTNLRLCRSVACMMGLRRLKE